MNYAIFIGLLFAFRIWLVFDQTVIARFAPQDDLLFVQLANSIASEKWLGSFNSLTLAKLPGYSIWLAVISESNIPVLFAQQLVYLLACLIILRCFWVQGFSRLAITFSSFILLFAPESFSNYQRLLIRDFYYEAISMLILAFWFTALYLKNPILKIAVVITYSLLLSFYSVLREEWIWITGPYLIFLILVFCKEKPKKFSQIVVFLALYILIPLTLISTTQKVIREKNKALYNTSILSDQLEGRFTQAITALGRIEPKLGADIIVSKSALQKAYKVSPAAKRLAQGLEGPLGDGWLKNGCGEESNCHEFKTWAFQWALRDAAKLAGAYTSAHNAETFFTRLSNEINQACEHKTISCQEPSSLILSLFDLKYLKPTLYRVIDWLSMIVSSKARQPDTKTQSDLVGLPNYYNLFENEISITKYENFEPDYYLKETKGKWELLTTPYNDFILYGYWQGFKGNSQGLDLLKSAPKEGKENYFKEKIKKIIKNYYFPVATLLIIVGLSTYLYNLIIHKNKPILIFILVPITGILLRVLLLAYLEIRGVAGFFPGYNFVSFGFFSITCALILVILMNKKLN